MSIGPEEPQTSQESLPDEVSFDVPAQNGANGNLVLAESTAALQEQLEQTKDARREERFCWFFGAVLVGDMWGFQSLGWWQATLVFLGELVLLALLARMWGIDPAVVLIERLLGNISESVSKIGKPKD